MARILSTKANKRKIVKRLTASLEDSENDAPKAPSAEPNPPAKQPWNRGNQSLCWSEKEKEEEEESASLT